MLSKRFRPVLAVVALAGMSLAHPAAAGIEEAVKALQADDAATAEKELQLLARERDPRAQYLLGLYVYGNPTSKLLDVDKAAPLLLDASQRGYAPAMIPLAGLYAEGKGMPQSYFESYKWLAIAERWHQSNALPLMEQVAKELKPDERAKAKTAAMSYKFKTK